MTGRYIPADVRRQLRKEANFGCVFCGAPVLEYHHIDAYSDEEHNDPDRMVALCPNHHSDAGPQAEAITPDQLYRKKENPHNSDIVDYNFNFESTTPFIKSGGNYFQLKSRSRMIVLQITNQPLVQVSFEDGILQFNTLFFDKEQKLAAKLDQNDWWSKMDNIWDLEYKGSSFKIWHQKYEIGLEVKYNSDRDLISIRGSFYTKNGHVQAYPSKTMFRNINAKVVGHRCIDHKVGMWYKKIDDSWEVIIGVDPRVHGENLNYI